MNLIEMWVSNITSHAVEGRLHYITAYFNCYGRKEYQTMKCLTECEWEMVKEKGYYLV